MSNRMGETDDLEIIQFEDTEIKSLRDLEKRSNRVSQRKKELEELRSGKISYETDPFENDEDNQMELKKSDGKKSSSKKSGANRKEKKRRKNGMGFVVILLILLLFSSAGLSCYLYLMLEDTKAAYVNVSNKEEEVQSKLDEELSQIDEKVSLEKQTSFEEGYEQGVTDENASFRKRLMQSTIDLGVVKTLRSIFPEYIVYNDKDGYVFTEIRDDLKKNPYDLEGIRKDENGFIDYFQGEEVASIRGIDVSKFNTVTDWKKVANDNIDFVFARVGFRGYTSGEINEDTTFETHVKGAHNAGLEVGAYFFTEAINEQEAIEEAEFVLEKIEGLPITFPVVIDVEKVNKDSARAENLPVDVRTDVVIAFCERIKEAGYTPMIYGNIKCFGGMLDLTRLEEYEKWFAFYDDYLYYPYELSCWQYSEKGKVNGIKENVDINVWLNPQNR